MTSRRPLRHTVYRSLVPGSGPKSRSSTIGATSSGRVAAIRVRRRMGRLTNWLASAPSRNVSANAFRSCFGRGQRLAGLGEFHVRHQPPEPR